MEIPMERLIPAFLRQDRACAALAAAIRKGLEGFCEAAERGVAIALKPEQGPEWRLDEMAWELGCLYDYRADIDRKRAWVKDAVPLYASYGTAEAIAKYLGGYFESVEIEEWWQYGAEGYHFRVIVGGAWTKESAAWAKEAIEKVKNVRSVLDYLAVGSEVAVTVEGWTEYVRFSCPMAGELMAGQYPGEAI